MVNEELVEICQAADPPDAEEPNRRTGARLAPLPTLILEETGRNMLHHNGVALGTKKMVRNVKTLQSLAATFVAIMAAQVDS